LTCGLTAHAHNIRKKQTSQRIKRIRLSAATNQLRIDNTASSAVEASATGVIPLASARDGGHGSSDERAAPAIKSAVGGDKSTLKARIARENLDEEEFAVTPASAARSAGATSDLPVEKLLAAKKDLAAASEGLAAATKDLAAAKKKFRRRQK